MIANCATMLMEIHSYNYEASCKCGLGFGSFKIEIEYLDHLQAVGLITHSHMLFYEDIASQNY